MATIGSEDAEEDDEAGGEGATTVFERGAAPPTIRRGGRRWRRDPSGITCSAYIGTRMCIASSLVLTVYESASTSSITPMRQHPS